MISSLGDNKLVRYFWCVLGLYLLNISVDATDSLYAGKTEDLSINNQESIIEIVIEKALGYDNAIAEQDDNDNQQETAFKKFQTQDYILNPQKNISFSIRTNSFKKEKHNYHFPVVSNPLLEIISPPPKV